MNKSYSFVKWKKNSKISEVFRIRVFSLFVVLRTVFKDEIYSEIETLVLQL